MVRLLVAAMIGLVGLVPAAEAVEGGLNYIVPAAAESSDDPDQRPPLPNVLFADGSGLPVHLRQYQGQVVVVNFWGSACGPCLKEMVFLDRLQGDFRGLPLAVLAISVDAGSIATVRAILVRQKLAYLRPFIDPGAVMAQALGVGALPTSIVIDRHGRQVLRVAGHYQWDSPLVGAQLKKLLIEP